MSIFERADIFGESVSFTVANNPRFGNVFGSIVTLLIFATVLGYGSKKFSVMKNHDDTAFMQTIEDDQIPLDQDFGFD